MEQISDNLEETVHASDIARVEALGDSLALGPLDHVSSEHVFLAVCFAYISDISYDRLRSALVHVLDRYPHLTGRFHIDSSGNRSIHRFGSGAILQSATTSCRLSEARDEEGRIDITRLPGAGSVLVPSYDGGREDGDPILSIKMTIFAGGGMVLGVRAPHSVCDASGFFGLVGHLAKAYDATLAQEVSHPPIPDIAHRPYIPLDESRIPSEQGPSKTKYPILEQLAPPIHSPDPGPEIEGRFLHFDEAYLQKLKEEAKPAHEITSKYRALTAHLWQLSHRSARISRRRRRQSSAPDLEVHPSVGLTIAINMRKRLPTIPPDLIFNAVLPCSTHLSSDNLYSTDLRSVAQEINTMIRQDHFIHHHSISSTIQHIHDCQEKSRIDFGWAGHFVSTQWPGDMYETSAMDGIRPDLVSLPILPGVVDGLLIVLPPPVKRIQRGLEEVVAEGEGLVAVLCLEKHTWDVIDELDLLNSDQARLKPGHNWQQQPIVFSSLV
jgi:hypothetical protein